jgi:histone H3/H4
MLKKRGGEKLPLNRIKKIMQANKEIGKIQSTTPQLIAWALEGFIEDITKKAAELCVINQDAKVTPSHIKEVVLREHLSLGFLKTNLASVPDFEINYRLPAKTQAEIQKGCKRKTKEVAKAAAPKK